MPKMLQPSQIETESGLCDYTNATSSSIEVAVNPTNLFGDVQRFSGYVSEKTNSGEPPIIIYADFLVADLMRVANSGSGYIRVYNGQQIDGSNYVFIAALDADGNTITTGDILFCRTGCECPPRCKPRLGFAPASDIESE